MPSVPVQSESKALTRRARRPWAALSNRPAVLGLLLAIATVALYYPVHGHPFVRYDDNDYVYENRQVQSGLSLATVKWAFTSGAASNWHPLTWLSHGLDCQLFGLGPAGPHDVNLLLHALDAVLLFWVLLRATGFSGRSFMVAALFALHPINVESVAWISERKNMLSMLFFLLALGAYRWYARRPGAGRYSAVALLFALGLMAKPQIITFPCVLLLWDYWPLRRMFPGDQRPESASRPESAFPAKSLSWLVVEKLPLLLIAAASAAITIKVQHEARSWYPRIFRAGNGILAYGHYIKNALWPSRLALMYPHPGTSLNWWKVAASAIVLLTITVLVLAGRRHRYLPVGWFWFLGTLVPMIGIVQVGAQAMADRYAYVSFLGLFIMICWGTAEWAEQKRLPASFMPAVSFAVLLALAVVARVQINLWQNNEALWAHTLAVTTDNWVAESQFGSALAIAGKVDQAVPHFHRAIAMQPTDSLSNMGMGIYELQRKNFAVAIAYYKNVVKDDKAKTNLLAQAYVGMAKAYGALGQTAESQSCLQSAKKVASR